MALLLGGDQVGIDDLVEQLIVRAHFHSCRTPCKSEEDAMMAAEVDDELKLMRASAGLLSDLQAALSTLLWKRRDRGRVHHLVRARDLDHVIQLVC